jgi:phage shock protein A
VPAAVHHDPAHRGWRPDRLRFTESLLEQYRGRVEQILNDVETRVQEARQSVEQQASERKALEKELNDAARQLLALEHRCAELMPASVA